jgi:hypothetical protein
MSGILLCPKFKLTLLPLTRCLDLLAFMVLSPWNAYPHVPLRGIRPNEREGIGAPFAEMELQLPVFPDSGGLVLV